MEWIIWVIVIVLIIAIVWWLLNRNNAGDASSAGRTVQVTPSASADTVRADGALSGGGAAASAAAVGTAGISGAAGFGRAAEPDATTTADDARNGPGAAADSAAGGDGPDDTSHDALDPQEPAPADTWAAPAAEPAAASISAEPAADDEWAAPAADAWVPVGSAAGDVDDWESDSQPDAVSTHAAAGQNGSAAVSGTSFSDSPGADTTAADGAQTLGTSAADSEGLVSADDSFDGDDTDNTKDLEAARHERAASSQQAEEDKSEWESQWSEAGGTPGSASVAAARPAAEAAAGTEPSSAVAPVHRQEYTGAHSPTLPGAESAAAEYGLGEPEVGEDRGAASADTGLTDEAAAETQERTESAAASETAASHNAEPTGHLATDQPYGEGSAAPAADGSGPAGYTVKGNAGSMIYYDETSGSFEETRAEVWFESIAHAEAAGFRAPRRTRT